MIVEWNTHIFSSDLRRERERLRGTCLLYPKDPDAPRKMEELIAREPNIIAFRIHAHRGKEMYLDSFASAEVRLLWEKALQLGLINVYPKT